MSLTEPSPGGSSSHNLPVKANAYAENYINQVKDKTHTNSLKGPVKMDFTKSQDTDKNHAVKISHAKSDNLDTNHPINIDHVKTNDTGQNPTEKNNPKDSTVAIDSMNSLYDAKPVNRSESSQNVNTSSEIPEKDSVYMNVADVVSCKQMTAQTEKGDVTAKKVTFDLSNNPGSVSMETKSVDFVVSAPDAQETSSQLYTAVSKKDTTVPTGNISSHGNIETNVIDSNPRDTPGITTTNQSSDQSRSEVNSVGLSNVKENIAKFEASSGQGAKPTLTGMAFPDPRAAADEAAEAAFTDSFASVTVTMPTASTSASSSSNMSALPDDSAVSGFVDLEIPPYILQNGSAQSDNAQQINPYGPKSGAESSVWPWLPSATEAVTKADVDDHEKWAWAEQDLNQVFSIENPNHSYTEPIYMLYDDVRPKGNQGQPIDDGRSGGNHGQPNENLRQNCSQGQPVAGRVYDVPPRPRAVHQNEWPATLIDEQNNDLYWSGAAVQPLNKELYTIEDVTEVIYDDPPIEVTDNAVFSEFYSNTDDIYENFQMSNCVVNENAPIPPQRVDSAAPVSPQGLDSSSLGREQSDDGWPSSDFETYEDDTNKGYSQQKKKKQAEKTKHVKLPKSSSSSSESSATKIKGKGGRRPSKQEESDEDDSVMEVFLSMEKHPPPSLKPTPEELTPQQITRRAIVSAIIDSESSYTSSLERIVEEYEKPLLQSKPQILNKSSIKTIFYKVKDILQCHNMFRIELAECIKCWDEEEKIGHVFTASFHKTMVFDVYSAFVNNFSVAMETVRQSARHKPAFADFLKQKTLTHADKLSLFGLMVKPVQRFPQFILFLQDLLKNTRKDHHDRLALQLALTELENLTHRLNETKRESENKLEVKTILSNLTGWQAPKAHPDRHLIRQDDMTQMKFSQDGSTEDVMTKSRRLFMMNDMLLCTSVIYRDAEAGIIEKFKLKWCVPIDEIEVVDSAINSDYRVMSGSRSISVYSKKAVQADSPWKKELDDLLHDLPLVIKISQLVSHLRSPYPGLSESSVTELIRDLQSKIEQKDELDWKTIQLGVPSKNGRTLHTFQVTSPAVKQQWLFDLCTAVLALDPKNNPGWGIPENETHVTTKLPLFMRPLLLDVTKQQDVKLSNRTQAKMCCAIPVFLPDTKLTSHVIEHLWVCSGDKHNGHITVVALNATVPHVVESFKTSENKVVCAELVPGYPVHQEHSQPPCFVQDTVWMATADQEIVIHAVSDKQRGEQPLYKFSVDTPVMCMRYLNHRVYMGLATGYVYIYTRTREGEWKTSEWQVVKLDTVAVKCLLPIGKEMWCACDERIHIISQNHGLSVVSHKATLHNSEGPVQCMVTAGVGLIVAFQNEAVVRLFHLESMEHLQDINLASAIVRILKDKYPKKHDLSSLVRITTMMASKGLLWIGTNIGCVLSLPLPRLEGVPQIRGRPSVSYHAHKGPIRFLVPIQCTSVKAPPVEVYDIDQGTSISLLSDDAPSAIQIAGVTETESSDDAGGFVDNDLYDSQDGLDNFNLMFPPSAPLGSSLMSSKSRWISTPDLRSSLVDDNAKFLYGSLLRGTDLDPESEMISPYLTLKKSRPGASIYTAMRRSIRKRSARHRQLITTETTEAEKGHTNDALRLVDQDDIEAEEATEEGTSSEDVSMSQNASTTSMLQIVASGGDGYVDWNKSCDKNTAYEDICLLLWQCRI